jgi:hypothetical protein
MIKSERFFPVILAFVFIFPINIFATTFTLDSCPASNDLLTAMSAEIDSRITNTVANNTTKSVFSTRGDLTSPWVRSSSVWTASSTDIDWSGVSPWNSDSFYQKAGVLISPRHIVLAKHYSVSNGTTFLFVAPDNSIVTRTLTAQLSPFSSMDITVGVLDSDVPNSITYYPIMSTTTLEAYLRDGVDEDTYKLPLIAFDQEDHVVIKETTKRHFYNEYIGNSSNIPHRIPTIGNRPLFDETLIVGDSGNPAFLMVGNKPVLILTHLTMVSGPSYSHARTELETFIDSLGGGHDLSDINLSCFNAPIVLRLNQSFDVTVGASNGYIVGTTTISKNVENNTPYFAINSGNSDGAFAMNSSSGRITVADSTKITSNNGFPRTVVVKVTETDTNGRASFATTTVNLASYPYFINTSHQFFIDENSVNGTGVGSASAVDEENDGITFSILSGNALGAFSINSSNGLITVADSEVIDYETNSSFNLVVKVQESSTAEMLLATTSVSISINNLSTRFDSLAYSFNLDEEANNNDVVGQVEATIVDTADNLNIYYSLVSGNDSGLFAINSSTGVITVVDANNLNADLDSVHDLFIGVSENSTSAILSTTQVFINITTGSRSSVYFGRSTTFANENTSLEIPINLSSSYGREVDVTYTVTDISTTNGLDHRLIDGTITIPIGSTSVNLSVILNSDDISESNESFKITISDSDRATLGFQTSHIITIRNVVPTVSSFGSSGGGRSAGGGGGSGSSVTSTSVDSKLVPEVQSNNKSLSSIIDLFIALGIISSEKALMARSFSANDVIVATTPTKSVSSSSTRSFSVGAKGEDVRFLQKALNTKSFFVAQKGDGSLGNETTYFGISTERALKLFQCKTFAICSGTPATTGYGLVGPKTSTALGI